MNRAMWRGFRLNYVADEPLVVSLVKYRAARDREVASGQTANLVSSHVVDSPGKHAPVIDLDFPHEYVPSSTAGHGHLYLNVPTSRWRMWALLAGLRISGNIEAGFFWWSLRRGATFVRTPGTDKP